jgi:hypothetical protein
MRFASAVSLTAICDSQSTGSVSALVSSAVSVAVDTASLSRT